MITRRFSSLCITLLVLGGNMLSAGKLIPVEIAPEDLLTRPDGTPAVFGPQQSDAEIADIIRQQIPELQDESVSPAARIESVRDWLHTFLPVGDRTNNLELIGVKHHNHPLGYLLYLAEVRRGGYYCGPITEISRRVYNALGFDAHSMNFRMTDNGTTHVTLLVRLSQEGDDIWTVQDTYFNFTVRDSSGRYVGYRKLIDRLEAGETNDLVLDEVPYARTPALHVTSNNNIIPRMSIKYGLDAHRVRDFPKFTEYIVQWDYEILLFMFPLLQELEETLGTNNPLYLLAFPLSTSGHDNVLALADYAQAAQARMLSRYAAAASAYTATRIDELLAADLARIRTWPKSDKF